MTSNASAPLHPVRTADLVQKMQAETLTSEACDKNKCKVFDFTDCEN
jgi:hypothetical protein